MPLLETAVLAAALALALALRPWRLLAGQPQLATPLLATLAVLPWLWALPALHAMPLQLRWSGAALVLLMLGWPLAVPALCAVGLLAWAISPLSAAQALAATAWQGVVPATLAVAAGAAVRRWLPANPFSYTLGRGFGGSLLALFGALLLQQALGGTLPHVEPGLGLVGRWLIAWGDAFVTGMLAAVFVAFRPQWLATWSDRLYLGAPRGR
jgi:uncharacterized membrane protein